MKPPDSVVDIFMKVMRGTHKVILKVSGGRILNTAYGMPVVELHTTGRKSGERRSVILTAPIHDENRYVVIASKGGDDRQPAWYLNLQADPKVQLTVDDVTHDMTARTATKAEKAEMWPTITSQYKGYAGYQERTDRDIPVVICEKK